MKNLSNVKLMVKINVLEVIGSVLVLQDSLNVHLIKNVFLMNKHLISVLLLFLENVQVNSLSHVLMVLVKLIKMLALLNLLVLQDINFALIKLVLIKIIHVLHSKLVLLIEFINVKIKAVLLDLVNVLLESLVLILFKLSVLIKLVLGIFLNVDNLQVAKKDNIFVLINLADLHLVIVLKLLLVLKIMLFVKMEIAKLIAKHKSKLIECYLKNYKDF